MLSRRFLLQASLASAGLAALPAFAAPTEYSDAAFAAAQSEGKAILIDISAPWCPTCKAQAPILTELEQDPKFSGMVVFHVDFDSQKATLRKFSARMQSTLIVFKGATEKGRSVGDTSKGSIAALLSKAA